MPPHLWAVVVLAIVALQLCACTAATTHSHAPPIEEMERHHDEMFRTSGAM